MTMMDVKSLKVISVFLLFVSSFIFCNVPIFISYVVKRYLVQSQTTFSNKKSKRPGVQKPCCSNSLNRQLEGGEIEIELDSKNSSSDSDDDESNTSEAGSKVKIEISVRSYFEKYNVVSTYVTCFASGIFLATSMLELLPNVISNVKEMQMMLSQDDMTMQPSSSMLIMSHEMPNFTNTTLQNIVASRLKKFPLAEFFVVLGILLVMTIEQVILLCNAKKPKDSKQKKREARSNYKRRKYNYQNLNDVNNNNQLVEETAGLIENTIDTVREAPSKQKHEKNSVAKTRIVILLIALIIHSVFEGLTIGLQVHYSILVNVLTAILIHKCLIAFSFGQQLVENVNHNTGISYKYLLSSNFLFSISNPLGIVIAILIVDVYPNTFSALIISLIKAISCGTFIYITFFEILPHELNSSIGLRLLKVFFIFIGFLLFSFIIFLN